MKIAQPRLLATDLCFVTLFSILSIPGTIALRYWLIALLLALLLTQQPVRTALGGLLRDTPVPRLLGLLSAWLLIQLLFTPYTMEVLRELKSQWLTAMIAFVLGTGMALLRPNARSVFNLVFAASAVTLIVLHADYLWQIAAHREWPDLIGTTYPRFSNDTYLTSRVMTSKVQVAFFAILAFTVTLAELLARALRYRRTLSAPTVAVTAIWLLSISANLLAGARNGLLGETLTLVAAAVLVLCFARHIALAWRLLLALVMLGSIVGGATMLDQHDPRWDRAVESVRYGMQPDRYIAWTNQNEIPYPKLPDGSNIEVSAFERTAFIFAGLQFSLEHPLGIGYTRQAFMHLVKERYGGRPRHAHSGFAEYLVGTGWPGLALWYAVLIAAIVAACRWLNRHFDTVGLVGVLLPLGFGGRMITENITRDHMLLLFMLSLGLVYACLKAHDPDTPPHPHHPPR
ncbi:O-antigen ligase family protein [Chitiniphilus eburneus]|uniref:O-antigen ligase family protein n=1 Tax=Chitiniphilus eburneus TaxID=2571148 RepID=A0A4U0Q852_9NEIS|nr:O-antigen ligase family protein [Chitiniphilus eburneus]TJZ77441.1 O-antigen ligase family protein [Chitiniphilus eburneus]